MVIPDVALQILTLHSSCTHVAIFQDFECVHSLEKSLDTNVFRLFTDRKKRRKNKMPLAMDLRLVKYISDFSRHIGFFKCDG